VPVVFKNSRLRRLLLPELNNLFVLTDSLAANCLINALTVHVGTGTDLSGFATYRELTPRGSLGQGTIFRVSGFARTVVRL
jgi:hypothetical protein